MTGRQTTPCTHPLPDLGRFEQDVCHACGTHVAPGREPSAQFPALAGEGWWPCCDHCGCGTPEGAWHERTGHDDTCKEGCND